MPPALLRLGQCLLIAALFCALGGHWLVLQTVAWGGMIVEYSHENGLSVAVEKTFDGQHPCDLCKTIAKSRSTEKRHEALVSIQKLDVFHETAAVLVAPAGLSWPQISVDRSPTLRGLEPALPPPRRA